MLQVFKNHALPLHLDLAVAEFTDRRDVESVRVLLRREGQELDLTPYLSDEEIEWAYAHATKLVAAKVS